jgi:hypothetical protein
VLTKGSGASQTHHSFEADDEERDDHQLIEIMEDEESSVDLKKN